MMSKSSVDQGLKEGKKGDSVCKVESVEQKVNIYISLNRIMKKMKNSDIMQPIINLFEL